MDIDEEVPRGFRFYPTEEELVSFYLHNKLNQTRPEIDRVIPLVDVYDYIPSDLPLLGGEFSPVEGEEWFFFTERESRGGRPNRLTKWGYWKATGSPGDVYSSENRVIGRKRSMVFYIGRAPNGTKTVWKMIEYKAFSAASTTTSSSPQLREELCLCRIYKQSKFLRAFDRRPPSAAVTGDEAAAAQHRHRCTGVTAFNNPADHSSFESSSSIDSAAANLSRFVESGSNRLPEEPSDGGGEILWDCARLNWFD